MMALSSTVRRVGGQVDDAVVRLLGAIELDQGRALQPGASRGHDELSVLRPHDRALQLDTIGTGQAAIPDRAPADRIAAVADRSDLEADAVASFVDDLLETTSVGSKNDHQVSRVAKAVEQDLGHTVAIQIGDEVAQLARGDREEPRLRRRSHVTESLARRVGGGEGLSGEIRSRPGAQQVQRNLGSISYLSGRPATPDPASRSRPSPRVRPPRRRPPRPPRRSPRTRAPGARSPRPR